MNSTVNSLLLILSFVGLNNGLLGQNAFLQRSFWKENPSIEVVKQKVVEGNNPEELNAYGFDAVVYALLTKAPLDIITYLMSFDHNRVDKITHDGRNYLLWATYKGDKDVIQYLIDIGSDVHLIDDHGNNAITFAAVGGQKDPLLYQMLTKGGAEINAVNHSGANALLLLASKVDNIKELDYLISQGLSIQDTDNDENGVFSYAARGGNMTVLKELIKSGLKPTIVGRDGRNAALFAAREESNPVELYEFLESLGVDLTQVDDQGRNALHYLANNGENSDLTDFFISNGLSINTSDKDGNTPFMAAVQAQNTILIDDWIDQVNDIDKKNTDGQTALNFAVHRANLSIANQLIDHDASLQNIDEEGHDMMYYAFKGYAPPNEEETNKIITLIEKRGLIENTNNLLEIAIDKQSEMLAIKALKFGAKINEINDEGLSALHLAAMKSRDMQMINFLLENGADKTILTPFDETALDLAKENELLSANNIDLSVLK